MGDIQKAVQWAVKIANDNSHGYSQAHRQAPDYDCSSLTANALANAGYPIDRDSWTGNLKWQLISAGFTECSPPWRAGDIHLNERFHVNMSISESLVVNASSDYDGKEGDSSGHEIEVKPYYEYSKGWDIHLRAPESGTYSKKHLPLASVAARVIIGEYGNGEERRERIEKETDFLYEEVQRVVNQFYDKRHEEFLNAAKKVIAGDFGEGEERKKNLQAARLDPDVIQMYVNLILLV